jgi:hypothetical protein
MLLITFAPLLASALLAESVGPVGTPGLIPLGIALLMLVIFGWGVVQRSWQTTVYDREEAARQTTVAQAKGENEQTEPASPEPDELP